jgi:hypothetical protein
VQCHGHQILACSAFAGDQYRKVRPSVVTRFFHGFQKRGALTDDLNFASDFFQGLLEFAVPVYLIGMLQGVVYGNCAHINNTF